MTVVYSRKRLRAERPGTPPSPSSSAPAAALPPPTVALPRARPSKKRRRFVQMHLDAGQRDISASSCATCGMVYAAGAVGDDAVHRAHHNAFLRARRKPFKYVDGMRKLGESGDGMYLAMRKGDSKAHIRALRGLDEFVTGLLGGREDAFTQFGRGWRGSEEGWMGVVFVVGGQAKGYVYAERVERAVEARVEDDGVTVADGDVVERTFCGVRKIWVEKDARRRGLATGLIDMARTNLIYGHVVEASDVAFTATTMAGGKLASSLAKKAQRERILVYTG